MTKYWVTGGEYEDTTFTAIANGNEEEHYGPFATLDEAYHEWSHRAWLTVDNCTARYHVVNESGEVLCQEPTHEDGGGPGRKALPGWIEEALRAQGGKARVLSVCRHIWDKHGHEIEASGEFFFTWQVDLLLAAEKLRRNGRLQPAGVGASEMWALT
ncbi:MAG: hypothetical protein CMM09_07585 [Rhodospirillaceae bacterium]|nr:hypothetical protein [Rhodospirillaceae bacterium]